MSTNRPRRIDRDAAEHLLAGGAARRAVWTPSPDCSPPLPPATAAELTGEEAAVTAFREAARLAPTRATAPLVPSTPPAPSKPRSRPMASCAPQRFRVPTRFLSAKAAVAALAVTAIGGVAVAAGTGHLPVVLGGQGHSVPADNTATSASASAAPVASWTGAPRHRAAEHGAGRRTGERTRRCPAAARRLGISRCFARRPGRLG